MVLNRELVGKHYPPQEYGVTAEAIINYARACNEDPSHFSADYPNGMIAPPMFGVVAAWFSLMTVVTDSNLRVDVLRLLHSEQDMYFFHPLAPGDIVTSRANIAAIDNESGGESLTIEVNCINQRNEQVQRMLFTAFIRTPGARGKVRTRTPDARQSQAPLVQVRQRIDADQTYRYAQASGDHNPIHVDENVAKLAGLPGIIVHGLCTMAFAARVIVDHFCDGNSRRLSRLYARFARPVFPGQEISTTVWPWEDTKSTKVYAYATYNPDGKEVIKDGIAEITTT